MGRPVLVGEAPAGSGHEPQPALEGRAGRTLARLIGVSYEEYLDGFERRNVFETPVEGRRWSRPSARLRGMQMASMFRHGDRVILLGRRVADAFGAGELPLYEMLSYQRVMTGETFWVGRVPHPSGLNRQLNDPRERDRAGRFLREVMRERR